MDLGPAVEAGSRGYESRTLPLEISQSELVPGCAPSGGGALCLTAELVRSRSREAEHIWTDSDIMAFGGFHVVPTFCGLAVRSSLAYLPIVVSGYIGCRDAIRTRGRRNMKPAIFQLIVPCYKSGAADANRTREGSLTRGVPSQHGRQRPMCSSCQRKAHVDSVPSQRYFVKRFLRGRKIQSGIVDSVLLYLRA